MIDIEGVDLAALAGWMDETGLPEGPIDGIEQLAGGTQNILVRFSRGGERYVLRRPPLNKRPESDETMRREAKVLAALAGSDVPHPSLRAACLHEDAVLGAAFYLMDSIEGANPTIRLPTPYMQHSQWQRDLGLAMASAAASIGAVDYMAAGLDGLGKPDGFLERQVGRWRTQLDSYTTFRGYPGPNIPEVDAIGEWLDRNRPTTWRPGLLHGDFHMANVLVALDAPVVAAVVDWELCTIGDPLLDLGWLLATCPDGDGAPLTGAFLPEPWDGFPTPAELVSHYAQRSERDLRALPWYEVLACYKLGIILEGTYARALAGKADAATGDRLHASSLHLFRRARRRIASS